MFKKYDEANSKYVSEMLVMGSPKMKNKMMKFKRLTRWRGRLDFFVDFQTTGLEF